MIFADVKLQPQDSAAAFAKLEPLPAAERNTLGCERRLLPHTDARASFAVEENSAKVPQPCIAFDGCKCRIYSTRPSHCQAFECLLLRDVRTGRTSKSAALELIRKARQQADKVWRLLRELGDVDEDLALGVRFRRTVKRLESSRLDRDSAAVFGDLTLATHDLNCLLAEAFYPG